MHRPLRVPFYLRVWNLIKGVLFYNTWNWEKASDGLNMPTLSRAEREKFRPRADLEIIRPREKPRARLDLGRKEAFSEGDYHAQVSEPSPQDPALGEETRIAPPASTAPAAPEHPPGEYVKRRKYKRRRTSSSQKSDGFFRRVFGRG